MGMCLIKRASATTGNVNTLGASNVQSHNARHGAGFAYELEASQVEGAE